MLRALLRNAPLALLALVTILGVAKPASAAPAATSTASISASHRTLALGATLVPGLVLHGAGHYAAGDTDTALALLAAEGVGVFAAVAGLAGLAVTGASRRTVLPLTAVTMSGVGLFFVSFLADVYGVAATGVDAAAPAPVYPIETRLGAAYVYDRVFDYGAFATWDLELRFGDVFVEPSAWVALDDDNARLRGRLAYRLVSDRRDYFDLYGALTHHHYGTDGFAITTAEAGVDSRVGLDHFADSLAGSFLEAGLGVALEGHRFFDSATHSTSLLVGGFGFGWYLPRGEAALYYAHRHDGFAAGSKVPGLGSGVIGHVGVRAEWFFSQLGFEVRAETGSAHVVQLALAYRGTP